MHDFAAYRPIGAVVLATLLCGCATVVDIADRHNDANLVQERVVNQQLLLNVVRAAHRQPLHFSSIPYIRLPLVNSAPWELTLPFGVVGPYARNSAKTSVGAQVITIEVTPQASQEFIQGITTPVSPSLMDLYFRQGWPQQLVLFLFVEEMRLVKSVSTTIGSRETQTRVEVVQRYRNEPSAPKEMDRFKDALTTLTEHCELVVGSTDGTKGPALPAPWNLGLAGLSEAVEDGLIAAGDVDGSLALQLPGRSRIRLVPRMPSAVTAKKCLPDESTVRGATPSAQPPNAGATSLLDTLRNSGAFSAPSPAALAAFRNAIRLSQEQWVEITLRSPDSMVYYLGELIRQGAAQATVAGGDDKQVPIFKVNAIPAGGPAPGNAALWVDFWDYRYIIARPPSPPQSGAPQDRSMQTLALVSQILQLKNKSVASPRSAPPLRVEPTP